jgi:hypothetical protein
VLAFHETKSVVTVQRQSPANQRSVLAWYKRFVSDCCVCKGNSTGRPSVSAERVETIRQSFERSGTL